jgi:uncharacterized protein YjiS (DUF1127 family)
MRRSGGSSLFWKETRMAKKGYRKTTPEERERWRRNQERLERLLEKALADLGISREELHRRVGFPPPGKA